MRRRSNSMTNLFDFFTGRKTPSRTGGRRKPSKKETRLCPGCPVTVEPRQLELPKMHLPDVRPDSSAGTDTKVVSIVDMTGYRKNRKPDPNTLF